LSSPLEHSGSVGYVYFSPDGEKLVTGTWEPDWAIRIWDAKSGQPSSPPIPDVHRLRCPPFNRDGRQLVTTWNAASAMIWDSKTGAQLAGPFTHDSFVWTAEFSPDGGRIVTASADGTVRIWGVGNSQQAIRVLNHGKSLWLARFSPDGDRVITVCGDMTMQLWDSNTGRPSTGPVRYGKLDELRNYKVKLGFNRLEQTAQFSPNGQMVVMAFGGRPLLLDGNTLQMLAEPFRHELVRSAEFSRDNQRVVTASLDGTAKVWGIRDGRQWVLDLPDQGNRVAPVFAPVPAAIPTLLEALAERRLNDAGAVESVPSTQVQALRRQFSGGSASDAWTQWGKWLLVCPTPQPIPSP
jgi:WD40 repeat protein